MTPPKVGDRVRLLGWDGECDGYYFDPDMQDLVGTEQVIQETETPFGSRNVAALIDGWGWPLSRVEKVEE